MSVIYSEEDDRTEDLEKGISLTSTLVHPSGYYEYHLTTPDKQFSILAEQHSVWDGPTDLSVPPKSRVVYVKSFYQNIETKDGKSQSVQGSYSDYAEYKSTIISLLRVHLTGGESESKIEVLIDFSMLDKRLIGDDQ